MKECARIRKLLSRYLDNELAKAHDFRVKKHLDSCLACRKELLELSRIKEMVLQQERKSLPQEYLVSRLWKRISQENDKREKVSWLTGMEELSRRLISIPVAAVALSIIFLFLCLRQPVSEYSLEEHILSGTQATAETALSLILKVQN